MPFYQDIEYDLNAMGGKILNTYKMHRYIADLANYYADLSEFTPKTWFNLHEIPEQGPFVLKGETNSKKFSWDTHMFAKDKKAAINVYLNLTEDTLVGTQQIYIRQFEKLLTYEIAPRGLPITKEFRFFILFGQVVGKGFYWSSHADALTDKGIYPDVNDVPQEFIQNIINAIGTSCNGYVLDVAQKENGDFILIECNDLQMSGLSQIEPDEFYKNMFNIWSNKYE